MMQDSVYMHWSGNNNQIYKALLELQNDGFVTNEIVHQESLPSKKIYTVTPNGLAALKAWAAAAPEAPEFKKSFLVQLAWADLLDGEELDRLLESYERELELNLVMNREKLRRGSNLTPRTKREAFLWEAIGENILSSCQNELDWVKKLRGGPAGFEKGKEEETVNHRLVEQGEIKYVEVLARPLPVKTEQDALELLSLLGEHGAGRLMLHAGALSEDFFRLRTGVAGAVLQKLVNYSVKTAVLLPENAELGPGSKSSSPRPKRRAVPVLQGP
jgi:DNA-binding PadR family transcriptional regulator